MKNKDTLLENRTFYYFDKLTKIPRCSFEEEKIRDYLISFAKDHDLEYRTDTIGNVVIVKEATEGYEDVDSIILQGTWTWFVKRLQNVQLIFLKIQ